MRSLWNQSGSKVIRGSLIVVPLDDSLIYLQPVYLQSTGFVFDPTGKVVVSVYSSGAIGRLVPEDVIGLVNSRTR